jgi:L-threonylcarbamoyladenylate synthase
MKQITTELKQVDPRSPEQQVIARAADLLRQGNLVAFPTETVYGLGADAWQPEALAGIFAAKGRPFNDPLIVHIAEMEELANLTTDLAETTLTLARWFWPGPLTLILPRSPHVPDIITAGRETVAVRMPRHPVARALIKALGSPIAAPSANRFMHVSPTTAQHVLADLAGRVPLILDGGPCEVGVESTILDLCADVPVILRPGGISLEELQRVLPTVQPPGKSAVTSEELAQKAPGQLALHYSPTTPLLLFDGSEQAMRAAILAELRPRIERGERVGVLIADEDLSAFGQADRRVIIHSLGDSANPAQVAAALFAGLRTLEEAGVSVILCRTFSTRELGLAVRDRLGRAAGGKIIEV